MWPHGLVPKTKVQGWLWDWVPWLQNNQREVCICSEENSFFHWMLLGEGWNHSHTTSGVWQNTQLTGFFHTSFQLTLAFQVVQTNAGCCYRLSRIITSNQLLNPAFGRQGIESDHRPKKFRGTFSIDSECLFQEGWEDGSMNSCCHICEMNIFWRLHGFSCLQLFACILIIMPIWQTYLNSVCKPHLSPVFATGHHYCKQNI